MQYNPYIVLMYCSLASSSYQLTVCPFYDPSSSFYTVISELSSELKMLKFLAWLLSLSSLLALSRSVNGALLPPPGARSASLLKRDGTQPVRRQDCAAPGLEVDQEQVARSLSNLYNFKFANVGLSEQSSSQAYATRIRKMISSPAIILCELYPIPSFTYELGSLISNFSFPWNRLAMAQESANGYCAQQYEVYNACLVLNDYDTIICGESRLRFLNCSKATYENPPPLSSSPSPSPSLSREADYKPLPSAHATTSNQALCIHARTLSCRPDQNL